MECKYCGREIKNKGALTQHEKRCEYYSSIKGNVITAYKNGGNIKKLVKEFNIGSDKVVELLGEVKLERSEAAKIAHKKYPDSFKHSDETKAKLRKIRLDYMKTHPEDTAWRKSNMSYPEKLFKNKIIELGWDKKYSIEREKSFFPYFVDFAFINEMVGVEIDGSQHLIEERIISDEKKDKLLNNLGWSVIRITAEEVKHNIDNVFNKISMLLSENGVCNTQIGELGIIKGRKKYYCKCGNEKSKQSNQCRICQHKKQRKVKVRPSTEQLINEVKETSYVAVGKRYGVSDNTIRKWIKK